MLAFGPDRYLYVGMGDGGSSGDPGNRAQDVNSLLGKILRINVDTRKAYAIPPTNPYVGKNGNDLVWSIGLRNPWRFSFDKATGDLWIGDVGQDRYEEIDRAKAPDAGRGVNYGWRVLEATHCYNPSTGCSTAGKTMPIASYSHSQGCSVTGGYVYRGATYADLKGVYLFGDYCSGKVWGLDAAGPNSPDAGPALRHRREHQLVRPGRGGQPLPRRSQRRHLADQGRLSGPRRPARGVPLEPVRPPPRSPPVTTAAPAKFFVNQGVVSSRTDMQNLLRPTLKQTVSYRFMRGRDLIAHGTGWVERIVADEADTSTYFTPISITLNIDSFEHLEFETRPDQLLVYTLVQGDERVIIEYAPMTSGDAEGGATAHGARQLEFDTSGFVQMELQGLDARDEG